MCHVRNYPIHGLDGFLNIKIVAVETPWRIYATREDEAASRDAFLRRVQDYDRTQLHRILEEEIFHGSLVFANIDNKFYRGAVQDQTNNTEIIQVWLGDYAQEETVSMENLYVIPSSARLVPWQVFACGIVDVCPIGDEGWSFDTCDVLREWLLGYNVIMKVWFPDVSAEAIWVDLLWPDHQSPHECLSIVDVMINTGHAQRATGSTEFDWGNGVGSYTDRRRLACYERKLASRRPRRNIDCQDGGSAYSSSVVVNVVEGDSNSQTYQNDDDDSMYHLDDIENVESNIFGYTNPRSDGFDSCGEAAGYSDDDDDDE